MLSNILPSRNQCKYDSTNIYQDNKIWKVIMVPDMLWTIAINVTRWLIWPITMRFLGKMSYLISLCTPVCSKASLVWGWLGPIVWYSMCCQSLQKKKKKKKNSISSLLPFPSQFPTTARTSVFNLHMSALNMHRILPQAWEHNGLQIECPNARETYFLLFLESRSSKMQGAGTVGSLWGPVLLP